MEKAKSIDEAIVKCEQNVDRHRGEARMIFRLIIFVLLSFFAVQGLFFIQTFYNRSVYSSLNESLKRSDSIIYKASRLNNGSVNVLKGLLTDSIKKLLKNNDKLVFSDYARDADTIESEIKKNNLAVIGAQEKIAKIPGDVNDRFLKIDNSIIYIIYGVFILVFGVLTSLYRFHLKEIAKYEHFLFGFERVRIAGNNSKSGYDDEVKISLSKDAFSPEVKVESKEIKRQVESPIPGHPTSDLAAALFSKILSAVEIKPKRIDDDEFSN